MGPMRRICLSKYKQGHKIEHIIVNTAARTAVKLCRINAKVPRNVITDNQLQKLSSRWTKGQLCTNIRTGLINRGGIPIPNLKCTAKLPKYRNYLRN